MGQFEEEVINDNGDKLIDISVKKLLKFWMDILNTRGYIIAHGTKIHGS